MTAPSRIPIIVLAGQSNANTTALAVEVYRHAVQNGGMVVHMAANGSALSEDLRPAGGNWNAGTNGAPMGNNLATLCGQLRAILDPASPSHVPGAYLDSVIWVQGEADAYSRTSAAEYASNLRAMKDTLTARFGMHEMVLSGLSDVPQRFADMPDQRSANWEVIQTHQRNLAATQGDITLVNPDRVAANAGMSADDMFRWDFIHYDETSGYARLLGRALALAALPVSGLASVQNTPVFAGSAGDDRFSVVLNGFRQVMAGPGRDVVEVQSGVASVSLIEASAQSTRVIETAAAAPRIIDLIGVEEVTLGWGHDVVRLAGGVRVVNTGAGFDNAMGSAEAETFNMGGGNDYAYGAGGNDTLRGHDGNDRVWGAHGNDMIFGGNGRDTLSGGADHDTLSGAADNDTLEGGDGHDRLWGDAGDDSLLGDAGDDRLWGGDGQDRLLAGTGNDTLFGGAGNDVLSGGAGYDLLLGGTGADIFVFDNDGGMDRIQGFDPRQDRIRLVGLDAGDVTITDLGDDLLIRAGDLTLRLFDIAPSELRVQDILFT